MVLHKRRGLKRPTSEGFRRPSSLWQTRNLRGFFRLQLHQKHWKISNDISKTCTHLLNMLPSFTTCCIYFFRHRWQQLFFCRFQCPLWHPIGPFWPLFKTPKMADSPPHVIFIQWKLLNFLKFSRLTQLIRREARLVLKWTVKLLAMSF